MFLPVVLLPSRKRSTSITASPFAEAPLRKATQATLYHDIKSHL